ncbi:MAG: hypothetical protein COZ05_17465 [Armatimonadetes bacterium CG_4_10_14_3_um_filter_59_10]|nr:MAG: hypothetical protein COZ05_17465 [Armatimonadetes bacterium CG_4_10_14_3_um_filter_59_10]
MLRNEPKPAVGVTSPCPEGVGRWLSAGSPAVVVAGAAPRWRRGALAEARSKYRRDNPEVYQSLRLLRATGGDRQDLLDQGWAWYQAWLGLPDADWTPSAEITKAAFLALHEESRTKAAAIVAAESAEKSKRATLNAEADDLWQDCVEWLEDACLSLAEDTPDGQVVRSVVLSHTAGDDEDDEAPQPPPP